MALPFWQSPSVPVCSTVLLLSPSIPTHGDDQLFSPGWHATDGWVHVPITDVALLPSTEYPDQFVLVPRPNVRLGPCALGLADAGATPIENAARRADVPPINRTTARGCISSRTSSCPWAAHA